MNESKIINRIYNTGLQLIVAIILPTILLFFTVTGYFQIQRQNQIESYRDLMNQKLNLLFDYSTDTVFFHAILQKNFALANKNKKPIKTVKKLISNFKSQYSKNFNFIIWNKQGKLIDELSDIKNYKYVLKVIYNSIKLVSESNISQKRKIEIIADIRKKIKLIRKIFGIFLVPSQMFNPIRKAYLGKCLQTSNDIDKGLLWYQRYTNFSVVCLIPKKLLNKNIASKKLSARFNTNSKVVKLGHFDLINGNYYGISKLSNSLKTEIYIEVEKYLHGSFPFRETPSFLLLFRQPNNKQLVFSYLNKKNHIIDISYKCINTISQILVIVCIIVFILFNFRRNHHSIILNIKQKLIFLFLFLNIIGLLIIVAASYKYFDYKKVILINDIHRQSYKLLKTIPLRFRSQRNEIASDYNAYIKKLNNIYGYKQWPDKVFKDFTEHLNKYSPSIAVIAKQTDKSLILIDKYQSINYRTSMDMFFHSIIDFSNQVDKARTIKNYSRLFRTIKYDILLQRVLHLLNKISQLSLGSRVNWSYQKLLGNYKKYKNWGVIYVSWNMNEMENTFYKNKIANLNKQFTPRKLIVMTKDKEIIYPKTMRNNTNIITTLHLALDKSKRFLNNLFVTNKYYIATSISDHNTIPGSMLMLYPRTLVETAIVRFKLIVFFIISLSSILLVTIGWLFSKELISPIKELETGIQNIRRGSFKQLIHNISNDELGELELQLNNAMVNMEMLSLGTSIQKNLLPANYFFRDKLQLYVDTEFMTKMGGDYFDYFNKNDETLTIVFGDVSGHGIPAGMIMGMVKAIFSDISYHPISPLASLKKANDILSAMKKRGWRGAMTCQCFDINTFTGNFTLANAGHCFPIIVSKEENNTQFIELIGSPLGARMSRRAKEYNGSLKKNEALILYSDGIVEAANIHGEMFGYDRFRQLLLDSWSSNVSTYWKNIYTEYKQWTHIQDDDITFMIVTINNEK